MKDEPLTLSEELEKEAREVQANAVEVDERIGFVEEYLDTLLPKKWEDMDLFERREYISGDRTLYPEGTVQRQTVSNIEIWCECFGKKKEDFTTYSAYDIRNIMKGLREWRKSCERIYLKPYGQQRVYRRTDNSQDGF